MADFMEYDPVTGGITSSSVGEALRVGYLSRAARSLRANALAGVDWGDRPYFQSEYYPEPKRVSAKQIHDEVYAECATLLENPGYFEEPEPEMSKRVATLEAMGFDRHPDLRDYRSKKQSHEIQKLQNAQNRQYYELALKYSLRYPNYKFITPERLDEVCNKYGLVTKSVGIFKGSIPEENIREMSLFHKTVTIHENDRDEERDGYLISATPQEFTDYEPPRPRSHGWGLGGLPTSLVIESQDAFRRWLVEDPIVLKPVKGGYLIVSAWGDEAKDPDVINERRN